MRIDDEDDPVDPFQDQFTGRVVVNLTGNRVELNLRGEAGDLADLHGEEIEEEGSFGIGIETDQFSSILPIGFLVDIMEVCCFSTQPGTVINDLYGNLSSRIVYEYHMSEITKSPSLVKGTGGTKADGSPWFSRAFLKNNG